MDGGSISNKMDTPKRIRLSTFCSYRDNVSQSNEAQVYVDYNNTSVASPTMVKPVIENVYIKSNIHSPICTIFWQTQTRTKTHCIRIKYWLDGMEGLRQQYSAEGLSDQTIDLLESIRRRDTLHHYKMGWRRWGSWCISRKIDPVSAGVNFVLGFLSNLFSERLEYRRA